MWRQRNVLIFVITIQFKVKCQAHKRKYLNKDRNHYNQLEWQGWRCRHYWMHPKNHIEQCKNEWMHNKENVNNIITHALFWRTCTKTWALCTFKWRRIRLINNYVGIYICTIIPPAKLFIKLASQISYRPFFTPDDSFHYWFY